MLDIVIAGAGIAGLSSALALRRAGHTVHIYERSSLSNEIGAAIMIPANASRPLLAWGMDPKRARMVTAKHVVRCRGDTLEKLMEEDLTDYGERFGAPWYWAHRVDLHEELRRLALGGQWEEINGHGLGEGGGGRGKVVVHLGCEVVDYDPERPSITLADGTKVTADVVVAADGIHSQGVKAVLGEPNPPQPQELYNFCYRFLIPTADIEADPDTRAWNEGDDGRGKFYIGDTKRIVWYPCRDNQVHNFVAIFHNENHSGMKEEDWQTSVDKSKLLDKYSEYHPSILAVFNKATEIKQYPLLYRPPIPTWIKGNMVLAGDAAHPMLPHQGQGGAQAIEDGVALGIALGGITSRDQVPGRLAAYEAIRRNRGSVMQVMSNAGQDEAGLIEREAARFIPMEQVPKNPGEFHYFNLGYDIVEDSVQVLKKIDSSFKLPADFFITTPKRGKYP